MNSKLYLALTSVDFLLFRDLQIVKLIGLISFATQTLAFSGRVLLLIHLEIIAIPKLISNASLSIYTQILKPLISTLHSFTPLSQFLKLTLQLLILVLKV